MLNIKVDEGYAFDYLAILKVKSQFIKSEKNSKNYEDCELFLKSQINDNSKWEEIQNSKELKSLIDSNIKTFEAVDSARYGTTTAKYVDECNMERYARKTELQKKFFPNSEIRETKN